MGRQAYVSEQNSVLTAVCHHLHILLGHCFYFIHYLIPTNRVLYEMTDCWSVQRWAEDSEAILVVPNEGILCLCGQIHCDMSLMEPHIKICSVEKS